MSGYGDAALKVQVSSPLQAMVDWQKMQQDIAATGQTTAQTGLIGQQTKGAALDNQQKAMMLGIRGQLLGATGGPSDGALLPGGQGGAPAGMPGAGQGGAPSYAPGFGDAGPTAVSTPFGVPIPRTAYLSAMMSPDPMKSVVETYNMGRQVISQTLTQAGDPTTDPAAAMRVQQAAQTLYANGWIGTNGYLQLMKDPAKAKVFVDATMSPDTHVSRANSLAGMGARLDENGQVVIDPGAIGAHATKSGAEAEAQVAPAVRKAGGIVVAETPGLVERKRQELEAGARYKTLEPIKVPDLDERGVQKVDKNGQPMFVERYVQPGVTGGSTAVPGQAPARGVNTRGPALQGPGASDGGNPLLGGLGGDPGSLASEGLPPGGATGATELFGNAPPPPPLPPLPGGAAAPAAPAGGAAAPTLGGMPALTPNQTADLAVQTKAREAAIAASREVVDVNTRNADGTYSKEPVTRLQLTDYLAGHPGSFIAPDQPAQSALRGAPTPTTAQQVRIDQDKAQITSDAKLVEDTQTGAMRAQAAVPVLLQLRGLVDKANPGALGDLRAGVNNLLATFGPEWVQKTVAAMPAGLDPKSVQYQQEFIKQAFNQVTNAESQLGGARVGAMLTQYFSKAMPNINMQPEAIKDMINVLLTGNQMARDYANGAAGHYNTARDAFGVDPVTTPYQPMSKYDERWTSTGSSNAPQVYQAASDLLNGKNYSTFAKGLTADQIVAAYGIATRADPSARFKRDQLAPPGR